MDKVVGVFKSSSDYVKWCHDYLGMGEELPRELLEFAYQHASGDESLLLSAYETRLLIDGINDYKVNPINSVEKINQFFIDNECPELVGGERENWLFELLLTTTEPDNVHASVVKSTIEYKREKRIKNGTFNEYINQIREEVREVLYPND